LNCLLDWANPLYDDGYVETAPVGSFPAGEGPFRLQDMAGNVFEWTLDWYSPDSYAVTGAENPAGVSDGEYRAARGGSWMRNGRSVRASYRFSFDPAGAAADVGFRCVREP
jgi:formylglycine-generating enzyme required for sulfatase activity